MNLWGFEAKPVLPGSGWGLFTDVSVSYSGKKADGTTDVGTITIDDSKLTKNGSADLAEKNEMQAALKAKGLVGDVNVEWHEMWSEKVKGKNVPKDVVTKGTIQLGGEKSPADKTRDEAIADWTAFATDFNALTKELGLASVDTNPKKAVDEFPQLVRQAVDKLRQEKSEIDKLPTGTEPERTAKATKLKAFERNKSNLEVYLTRGNRILKEYDSNHQPTSADETGLKGLVSGQSTSGSDDKKTSGSGEVPDGLVRAASGGGPSSFYMHSASGGPGGGSEFGFGASTGFGGGIDGGFGGGIDGGFGFGGGGFYSDFTGIGSTIFGQHVDNRVTEKKLEAMIRRMMMRLDYDSLAVILHVMTARVKLTVIKAGFELVKIMGTKLKDQEKNVQDLQKLAGQTNLGPGAQAELAGLNNQSQQANNLVQLAMGMFKQNHAALEEMSNEANSVQRDIINHKREASRSA